MFVMAKSNFVFGVRISNIDRNDEDKLKIPSSTKFVKI
jgi:hypothetical protein